MTANTKETAAAAAPEAAAAGHVPAATAETPAKPTWGADPVPEQQPWRTPDDAKGWRRIYRGTGQKRQVKHSVVLDLTPEQWSWLNRAAGARDAVLHDFLSALIEEARLTDEAAERRAEAENA
jgi:hypothetical protein